MLSNQILFANHVHKQKRVMYNIGLYMTAGTSTPIDYSVKRYSSLCMQ